MTDRTPTYDFYPAPTAPVPTRTQGAPEPVAPGGPAAAPSAPVFGTPALGTQVNQFGTPIATPGASVPSSFAPARPVTSPGLLERVASVPRWVWRWVLPLTVTLVLGLFGVGKLGFLDVVHGDVELPASLVGQPLTTSSGTDPDADQAVFGTDLDGLTWGRYAGVDREVLVTVVDFEMSDAELSRDEGDGFGPASLVGTSWCSSSADGWSWCARSVDGRTVEVHEESADLAGLAAVLDELAASIG